MLELTSYDERFSSRVRDPAAIWLVLVIVGVAASALFLAVALRSYANDDPYITYRYARNLAQGKGMVFNAGLNVLSTTTPLYTFILAVGSFVMPDLPAFSNVLSALSLGLAVILLYRLAAAQGEGMAGLIGGLLTLFFPLVVSSFGAETAFHISLIIASFYWYSQERLNLAAAAAGLATLTRGDGVLVAIALATHFLWTRRRFPLLPFLVYLVIIAPWYIYSWLHFGSPFPATLQAKLRQSGMAVTTGFVEGVAYWARRYARRPIYWLYLPLIVGGALGASRRHKWAIPLLLWAFLYLIGYGMLNVPRYHWYYSPLIPPLMLLFGLGVSGLVRYVPADSRIQLFTGLALAGLLVWPSLKACQGLIRNSPDGRAQIYTVAGKWLNQNTPSEAAVGTLEVGILGYYSQRSIVDFAGLIQPDVARQVEAGYENAAIWAVGIYQPEYLVFHPAWFPRMVAASWFSDRYRIVKQFENERYASNPLVVYAASGDSND